MSVFLNCDKAGAFSGSSNFGSFIKQGQYAEFVFNELQTANSDSQHLKVLT